MPLMMIHCPGCSYNGEIEYVTRRPDYCTPACKQKAYRLRVKKRNGKRTDSVTHLERWVGVRYADGVALVELVCDCDRRLYASLLDARELLYRPITCGECDGDFKERGAK